MSAETLVEELFSMTVAKERQAQFIQQTLVSRYSPAAAALILERLCAPGDLLQRLHDYDTGFVVMSALQVIKETARPLHVPQLFQLLARDEILMDSLCRTNKCLLLETIAKVGDGTAAAALESFSTALAEIRYRNKQSWGERRLNLNRQDQINLHQAIAACNARSVPIHAA